MAALPLVNYLDGNIAEPGSGANMGCNHRVSG